MGSIIRKWNETSLILRIIGGLIIGIVLGFAVPNDLTVITLLGSLFVGALKAAAPVLVLFLVASALMHATHVTGMRNIILLYVVSTLVAALVAVVASFLAPSVLILPDAASSEVAPPSGISEVLTNVLMNVVDNPVHAIQNANYVGILAWGVALGLAMRAAKQATKDVFESMAEAITIIVRGIISCAPFGIMGLIYDSVSTTGAEIFTTYGHLLAVLVVCMAFIALVTNPLMAFVTMGKNPYPLVIRCLKDSGVTAFFTRSSAANIPVNMSLCQKLGLSEDTYSVSIPLGATINMAGAAVTITVMAMAACTTLGVTVDIPTAVLLCALAAVSACGASGVAGGSLLLIPLACSLFGIPNDIAMQVVAVGFVIGVIQDSCETALNSSSDVLLTACADYREKRKAGIAFNPGKDAE